MAKHWGLMGQADPEVVIRSIIDPGPWMSSPVATCHKRGSRGGGSGKRCSQGLEVHPQLT